MSQLIKFQILRATTSQRTSYTPAPGELLLDTDENSVYIGDGSTAGGLIVTSVGSSGESNTGSNVGTGGVGLFKQKNGVTLEFKNISAGSNKVSITNDVANNEVDIDLVLSNIDTSELNNDAGFQTAGQVASSIADHELEVDPHPQYETSTEVQAKVDAHANLTNNPHAVTKAQVGLGNVDNTSDLDKPISTATQSALNLKYDASNPDGYETPAELNTRDTANRNRSNHSGTQLASTISDLQTAVYAFFDRGYASTDGQISTTSTAYVQAQTLNHVVPSGGGRYLIMWSAEIAMDSVTADFELRVQLDNTTTLSEIAWEAQEAGTDNFRPVSGFYEADLSAGSHNIDIDYSSENGVTAYIRRRRLRIQRIG
jgi:hypothetical protein